MNSEEKIGQILREKGLKISTAESCTGGLLSSKLTDISGSSAYITLNLVTYAVEQKRKMLGVVIEDSEVVSENCAFQMAKGLYELTGSDICVSTTGIAGPTGGCDNKPVGLMFSSVYSAKGSKTYKILLDSSIPRKQMKELFVEEVLKNILNFLEQHEF